MAKKFGKLASRYAQALYRAIEDEKGESGALELAEKVSEDLNALALAWDESHEFSGAMLNPMFDPAERLEALKKIAAQAKVEEIVSRFLVLVYERDRIAAFPEIASAFAEVLNEEAQIVRVAITTAREVEEKEAERIEKSLGDHISGNLKFSWNVESDLIGGMLVSYSGTIIDGSVRGKLKRIEQALGA